MIVARFEKHLELLTCLRLRALQSSITHAHASELGDMASGSIITFAFMRGFSISMPSPS